MPAERRRSRRWLRIGLVSLLVFAGIWFAAPWLYLKDVRVEGATLRQTGARPAQLSTPQWIVVRFSTGSDLTAFRKRWRVPFIQAELRACDHGAAGTNDEVVTQRAEYFVDNGRVRLLGRVRERGDERFVYEATFDNALSGVGADHVIRTVPAATVAGGLCFRLHGAMPAQGSVRSASLPLRLRR